MRISTIVAPAVALVSFFASVCMVAAIPEVDIRIPNTDVGPGHVPGISAGDHVAAYSPDGKSLVIGKFDGHFARFDFAAKKVVRQFDVKAHDEGGMVAFSSDSRYVGFVLDNRLSVADATTGKTVRTIPGTAVAIAFSPDNKLMAASFSNAQSADVISPPSSPGVVSVYRLAGWQKVIDIKTDAVPGALDFSAVGNRLLLLTNRIDVYQLPDATPLWRSPELQGNVMGAAMSPNGGFVADADGLWKIGAKHAMSNDIDFQSNAVWYRRDGGLIATQDSEYGVNFYDGKTGAGLGFLDAFAEPGVISPDFRYFASIDDVGNLTLEKIPDKATLQKHAADVIRTYWKNAKKRTKANTHR